MCMYIVFISYLPSSQVCRSDTLCKQDEFKGVNRIWSMWAAVHHPRISTLRNVCQQRSPGAATDKGKVAGAQMKTWLWFKNPHEKNSHKTKLCIFGEEMDKTMRKKLVIKTCSKISLTPLLNIILHPLCAGHCWVLGKQPSWEPTVGQGENRGNNDSAQ